jgi:hypothetical protein
MEDFMLKKNQFVLFSALSLSVAAIGNSHGSVGGITSQEYKEMHTPDAKCGIVCQRKKAIEEAEKRHKEEAARPVPTRRMRAPAVSRAEEQKIEKIEKDIVEARELLKELDNRGGSAALNKITADLEKDKIPSSQAESILGALSGGEKAEEKMEVINLPHPPLKMETTETEENIVTNLTLEPRPEMANQPTAGKVPPPPPISGMEAIRKRRID